VSDDQVRALAQRLLDLGVQELSARERRMIEGIAARHAISRNINQEFDRQRSFGDRLSDRVAEVGGSWSFIVGFGAVILLWMALNGWAMVRWGASPFDPYPFIFLNFILSLVAALQAPVIMMSQNRQADKDRLAAAHDYEVNLKAEVEILALHDKLDQIRAQELKALLERVEMMVSRIEAEQAGSNPAATASDGPPAT
jgi:uncharacterized membrane protein